MVTLADALGFAKGATDAEKAILVKELGLEDSAGRIATLSADLARATSERDTLAKANADLTQSVKVLSDAKLSRDRDEAIGKALAEGRILPKDKAYWEGKYSENPAFVGDLLAKLPKAVDLSERGTAAGGEAPAVTPEERETFRKLGLSDEAVKDYEKFEAGRAK